MDGDDLGVGEHTGRDSVDFGSGRTRWKGGGDGLGGVVAGEGGVVLDEPFAALDGRRRRDFARVLKQLSHDHGVPMIVGEFKRTNKKVIEKKSPRRKRLPYAASGRIEDAADSITEASRLLGLALKEKDITVRALQMATASHELHNASTKLLELKVIQQIEE